MGIKCNSAKRSKGRTQEEERWWRVTGLKEWCDTGISHSFSRTTVATGTKGTLIYPISRARQASHNVPACCFRLPCFSVCACVCILRESMWIYMCDMVLECKECFKVNLCVCVYVCVCVCACVHRPRNDSSASCSLVKMTQSCQINIIAFRV